MTAAWCSLPGEFRVSLLVGRFPNGAVLHHTVGTHCVMFDNSV